MVKCDKDINMVDLKEIIKSLPLSLWLGKSKFVMDFLFVCFLFYFLGASS